MSRTDLREPGEATAIAGFLRRLADAVERDAALGERLAAIVRESWPALADSPPARKRKTTPAATASPGDTPRGTPRRASGSLPDVPDPFALLREHGEQRLREELALLDLPVLRAIIRAHRLDPARISARWTARDRVLTLIVEQVRARASHGRAFERV